MYLHARFLFIFYCHLNFLKVTYFAHPQAGSHKSKCLRFFSNQPIRFSVFILQLPLFLFDVLLPPLIARSFSGILLFSEYIHVAYKQSQYVTICQMCSNSCCIFKEEQSVPSLEDKQFFKSSIKSCMDFFNSSSIYHKVI